MAKRRSRPRALGVRVAAEDPLARAGLAAHLAEDEGLDEVEDDAAADVVLADHRINGPAGGPPVVAMVANAERAREALRSGARGVLFRDAGGERVRAAVRAVHAGLLVLDEGLDEALVARPSAEAEAPVEALTPRELEVLGLLAAGRSNKEIAQALGISEHTAKFHVNAIFGKLGAEGRTDAVVKAARLGLVLL